MPSKLHHKEIASELLQQGQVGREYPARRLPAHQLYVIHNTDILLVKELLQQEWQTTCLRLVHFATAAEMTSSSAS